MNSIRQTQQLNKRELENCTPPSASWHRDYADTAFVYIGGLAAELTEGDIITIFSQYGEPVYLNLVRDKETGKSKGFAFLKYADQRSCDLAVDNLGGASVRGRLLNVDHTRYKKRDDEDLADNTQGFGAVDTKDASKSRRSRKSPDSDDTEREDSGRGHRSRRKLLKEEEKLDEVVNDEDNEDPMKAYLIEKKREEVAAARRKHHRRRHSPSPERRGDSRERHRRRNDKRERHRSRSRSRSRRRVSTSPRRKDSSRRKHRRSRSQSLNKRDRDSSRTPVYSRE